MERFKTDIWERKWHCFGGVAADDSPFRMFGDLLNPTGVRFPVHFLVAVVLGEQKQSFIIGGGEVELQIECTSSVPFLGKAAHSTDFYPQVFTL